ncbi:MAG: GatB/YqeY domain-containing protein [Moraxellaceae bacterium]|nr:GatB/YqeY domain-containing protein [Moraxellaceae bacterium]
MMTIKTTITDTLKTAMKAGEKDKVKVLRNLQAVIKKIEIDDQVELNDTAILAVLQKQIKQRQESLAIYQENNRADLAEKEQFEMDILQEFMPKQMSEEELTALVQAEIAKQGATSMKDMGKVMGALKAQTTGKADPAVVSKLVKQELTK